MLPPPAGLGPSPARSCHPQTPSPVWDKQQPSRPRTCRQRGELALLVAAARVSRLRRCSHARAVLLAAPSSSAPAAPLAPSSCQTWPGDRFWAHSCHPALPKPLLAPGTQTHTAGEDLSPAFGGRWCLHRGCLLACRSAPQHQLMAPAGFAKVTNCCPPTWRKL